MEAIYARTEHGGHPVRPLLTGFEVSWPNGPRRYPSARQTIIALVNRTPEPEPHAYDPHMSFDRYFRRGRYTRGSVPRIDIFALFRPDPPNRVTIARSSAKIEPRLTVHVAKPKLRKAPVHVAPEIGIDLQGRSIEVRKLFYSQFAKGVYAKGYDPEDVLQDIYVALAVRNRGKCPFNPKKGSFANYVCMVCRGTVSNYHRRYGRLSRNEQFGVSTFDSEVLDVAQSDLAVCSEPDQEYEYRFESATGSLTVWVVRAAQEAGIDPTLAERCVMFLFEGWKYKDIAAQMKCSVTRVSEAVKLVRRVATEWQLEMAVGPSGVAPGGS